MASYVKNAGVMSAGADSTLARRIGVLYLCGVILFGKEFTYISVGPLYISEIVLGLLLVLNASRLELEDFLLISMVGFYFAVGLYFYGSVSMVGKDLAWLYYTLFLVVFPRSLSDTEFDFLKVCFLTKCFFLTLCAFHLNGGLFGSFISSYSDGIAIIAFYIYDHDRNGKNLPLKFEGLYFFAALGSGFKTSAMVYPLLRPLLRFRDAMAVIYTPKVWIPLVVGSILILKSNVSYYLMIYAVEGFNTILGVFGGEMESNLGTSSWRTIIWTEALRYWESRGLWLFGEFPGHNFLDPHLIPALGALGMTGGEGLGVNRSPHNILVLIALKTGIVGFLTYYGYTYTKLKNNLGAVAPLLLPGLLMALTGNVLETPYGAPMFYIFMNLIIHSRTAHMASMPQTNTLRSSIKRSKRESSKRPLPSSI